MKNGWIKQHSFSSQPYEKSWQAPKIFSLSINLDYSPTALAVFINNPGEHGLFMKTADTYFYLQ